MLRLTCGLLALGALAACNTAPLAGKGDLVVHSAIVERIETWERSDRLSNLSVAIEANSRSMGAVYCADGPDACIEDNGLQAVTRCEERGDFKCGLFLLENHVIWEGAILYRHREAGQNLPYNGVWPISLRTPKGEEIRGHLYAKQFRIFLAGLDGLSRCPQRLSTGTRGKGEFGVTCPSGLSFSGIYTLRSDRVLTGSGDGYELTIDFRTGRQLVPNEELKFAKK